MNAAHKAVLGIPQPLHRRNTTGLHPMRLLLAFTRTLPPQALPAHFLVRVSESHRLLSQLRLAVPLLRLVMDEPTATIMALGLLPNCGR